MLFFTSITSPPPTFAQQRTITLVLPRPSTPPKPSWSIIADVGEKRAEVVYLTSCTSCRNTRALYVIADVTMKAEQRSLHWRFTGVYRCPWLTQQLTYYIVLLFLVSKYHNDISLGAISFYAIIDHCRLLLRIRHVYLPHR